MPTPSPRPSLETDLESRYANQRVGSAFDVKEVLSSEVPGRTVDAQSMQANEFQSPAGFEVGVGPFGTQMKDAQGNTSGQLSRYMQGFSNRRYRG